MQNIKQIAAVLKQPKYFGIFVLGTTAYFLIYYLVLKYLALVDLKNFFKVFSPTYSYPAFALAVLISILIGMNFSLLAAKINAVRSLRGSAAGLGVFFSVLATGCPSCGIGAFPFVMSLFGISATLGSLPFGGIELQLLSVALLLVSIYCLSQQNVCK